jgi:hypothetical protein
MQVQVQVYVKSERSGRFLVLRHSALCGSFWSYSRGTDSDASNISVFSIRDPSLYRVKSW